MGNFVKVATLADLPTGKAMTVEVSGTPVALYNVGGTIYATTNTCPHRGGPLGEGDLDQLSCRSHRADDTRARGKEERRRRLARRLARRR